MIGVLGAILAALVFHAVPGVLRADPPASAPVIEFATGLPGKQVRLSWAAHRGHRYRVERSDDLTPGSWRRVALVTGNGPNSIWLDPEAVKTRCFYRVTEPAPEVFSVEPPILSESGGTLEITGQNLPPSGALAMDIEGAGRIVTPYTQVIDEHGNPSWRVVLNGPFTAGALVSNVAVVDGADAVISPVDLTFTITASGYAADAPASLPPSAPLALGASKPVPGIGVIVKKHPPSHGSGGYTMSGGYWNDWDEYLITGQGGGADSGDDGSSLIAAWLSKKGYDFYQSQSGKLSTVKNNPLYKGSGPRTNPLAESHRIAPASSGLPGEVSFHYDALSLPNFAGPPLAWIMTYRSTRPVSSGHGPQWDFSYNIRIEAANSSAPHVTVHDGGGRSDVFLRQADGTYRCDGMFREGKFTGDTFTLTFADQGKWVFHSLGASPAPGKIASIIDRNGVALTCNYDAGSGRLVSVNDSFARALTVTWDASGSLPRISSITDSSGRSVHFAAYDGGAADDGGPDGALKSISRPNANGTPPGSPDVTFTYHEGSSDARLNHNLLTITDGADRLLEGFEYSAETDYNSPDYDRCASHNRHVGVATRIKRVANASGGYTSYEVDEVGRLTEIDCDRQHRVLAIREFTGFCTPGVAADATTNRPGEPLRASDPSFFETRFTWNPDHGLTRIVDAAGTELNLVYDREFRAGCPVRERGNIRTMTLRSSDGAERVVSCEYLPGFGPHESARPGNPIKGITVKGGRNPGPDSLIWSPRSNIVDPDDDGDGVPTDDMMARGKGWDGKVKGSNARTDFPAYGARGHKGWDGLIYGPRPTKGKGAARFKEGRGSFNLQYANIVSSAKMEGGRHTPFHNKYRPQYASKERGITINTSHIEYETSRIIGGEQCDDGGIDDDCDLFRKILDYGEAGENRAFTTRLVTAHGQALQWTYDEHGNRTSYIAALPNRGALYQYDSDGRCTAVTVNGDGDTSYQATFSYDPVTGFLESTTIDPGVLAITTSYQYDTLGRCTHEIDPFGHEWVNEYNPSDQVVRSLSPPHGASGARIATTLHYDNGGRLARCDVEDVDDNGAPVNSDATHTTFFVRDEQRAQLIRIAVEERPVDVGTEIVPDPSQIQNFAVVDFTRNAAGDITRVSTPAACREESEDLVCDFSYDERGLIYEITDGGAGAASTVKDRFDYTTDGLLACHTRVGSGVASPITEVTYDGFRRVSTITDPMGNLAAFSYDNRGGISCSIFGQLNDVEGIAGNTLLAQTFVQSSRGREPTAVLALACSGGPEDKGSFLSLPGVQNVEYSLATFKSSESVFHRWFVKDDTLIEDRFEAGQTAPHAQETTVVTRSAAGFPTLITCNNDELASITRDTAGRDKTYWNVAMGVEFQRNAGGQILQCATTHLRSGAPPKTFTLTYAYDPLGRVTSESDSVGNTTSYGYDFLGRVISIVRPGGLVVHCDHNGETPEGLLYSKRVSTDLEGDGMPDIVVSSYSRCGELKSATDALGHATSFQQDPLGRLVRCDHPDGTYETQSYDSLGFPNVARFRDGATRDEDCDFNGRVITQTVDHPNPDIDDIVTQYTYDGRGRVCTCHQGSYIVTLTHDSLGNRIRESRDDVHVDSTYDHHGRTSLQTSVQGPYPLYQTEQRDGLGRLLSISDATSDASSPPVVSLEYLGLLVSKATIANGVSTEFTYRGDGDAAPSGTTDFSFGGIPTRQVCRQSGTQFLDSSLTRDRNQEVITETTLFSGNPMGPGRMKTFTRDSLGRITGCVMSRREALGAPPVTELDVTYTLDARGDRLTAAGGANPGSYTQSTTDAQRSRYSTWPAGALAWDETGNLTSMVRGSTPGVTHEYHYDALGRLTSVTDGAGLTLIECTYDGFNRLVSVATPESSPPRAVSLFLYDGPTCVQELTDAGGATMNFITSGGALYAMKTGGGVSHYPVVGSDGFRAVSDSGDNTPIVRGSALGGLNDDPRLSVRMITDATGAVVEQFDCDDACKPVFLDATGIPSTASSSATGLRWMAPECLWVSEISMFACPGGVYSPDLGRPVSSQKAPKSSVKKELMNES